MKKSLLMILLCGALLLGLTGCGDKKEEVKSNDNSSNNVQQTETKKLKVGDYEINYGFYKSYVRTVKIMEDGKCTWDAIDYSYYVEDNHICFYIEGEYKTTYDEETGEEIDKPVIKLRLRVENETTLINDTTGEDIETFEYYDVN